MLGGAVAASALLASAYTFREFKVAPAEKLFTPIGPDSLQKENPFKAEDLLKARAILPDAEAAGWTTMVPDTAGRLRLVGPADVPMLHTFTTRLRAPRFVKGRLVLNSTSRASVKVNGEEKISKATADSLPQDAETTLDLNPEADYAIRVTT